ncbi:MAG: hypothetical protein H5T50_09580, partial [Nitrososphaeria archaeon]|nr:hypothetical protein [Nitrososphaeria archaeon]
MGVWHLSGLGKSPGAVTVPLTYVYIMLKAASLGDRVAKEFFLTSGEYGQEFKGAPEGLILFTSKEIIDGSIKGNARDDWFRSCGDSVIVRKAIAKYLFRLLNYLRDSSFTPFYGGDWIKDIYLVEVRHDNFDDCYFKIGVTVRAFRDKELWANMIGGTNQINYALLISGSLFAAIQRYYYIFQSQTELLHPDIKISDLENLSVVVKRLFDMWHELPIFQFDIGPLISRLCRLFEERGNKINIKEVKQLLRELNYSDMYLPKIRGKLIT